MRTLFLWLGLGCIGYCVYVTAKEHLNQSFDQWLFNQPATSQPDGVLGKIEISRLHLAAMVREGVDDDTLSTSVGHVPSTALPGHSGNFALAAHRDTLFRALKDIKRNDLVTFQSRNGTFTYRVHDMRIVKPTDVAVLRSDGHEELTLITCYPFYFIGSAPERFVVRARLVSETAMASAE